MPRVSPYQGNFSSGEFSPLLFGRTDADRYKTGLARCYNMVPTLQGAATRRPGTKYINNAKNNAYTRLIPFKFSNTISYLLEFGNTYIRFYTNRGRVETSPGVAYEIVSPYSQSDLPNLKFAQSLDVVYIVAAGIPPQKLSHLGNTNWTLTAPNFKDGPYANTGSFFPGINGPRLQVAAAATLGANPPYNQNAGVQVVSNVITAVTNAGGLFKVTVTDSLAYLKASEYNRFHIAGVTGTVNANGDWYITIIDSYNFTLNGSTFAGVYAGAGTATDMMFIPLKIPQDANKTASFRFKTSATLWQTGFAMSTVSSGGVVSSFNLLAPTYTAPGALTEITEYRVPAWGASTTYNPVDGFGIQYSWPTSVVFHDNRLYFGGAGGTLQRIDASKVGDYENFGPSEFALGSTTDNTTVTDACAVSISFLSGESNLVKWMTSDEQGLAVGTSGGPWIVRPSSLNQAITPTNISAKRVTAFGASDFPAVVAGKSSLYIESTLRRVRELAYFYNVDGFRSIDLSELSEHLSSPGIATELAFQNVPQNIVWCARSDGTFLGITYDRTLDALRTGWHQHQLGGVSDTTGTPPIVESLAIIPSPDGTTDDLWMSVKRYINGTTIRSIEYVTKLFESFNQPEDAFFVDCGATFDSPVVPTAISVGAVTTITKAAHGLATGAKVRFRKVTGVAAPGATSSALNYTVFTITVLDANTFTVPLNSTGYSAFIVNGLAVYRKMVTTISGLTWLEGQTVQILGDGADMGTAVVASGAITLPSPGAGTVQIGLGYSSEIKGMRIEGGSADGTSMGKVRRIQEVQFMVDRSGTFEYGMNDYSAMFPVDMRQPSDPIDQATPLFTGIKDQLLISGDYETEEQITVRQRAPLPLTILAVMPQMTTYDKG